MRESKIESKVLMSKHLSQNKASKSKRASKVLLSIGLALLIVVGVLLLVDDFWTQSSINKHEELEEGRTPALALDRTPEVGAAETLSQKGSEDALPNSPDSSDDEDTSDVEDAKAVLTPAPNSYPLDSSTLENYGKIGGVYPDFKGWIEMPAFDISYALFVDPTNVAKYERHDRDGNLSKMGEVGYVGDPYLDYNFIVYGHSLSNRQKGFQPIDNYPDFKVNEEQRRVFIDLLETGERREYKVVSSRYYKNGDNPWFRYRFKDRDEHSKWFKEMTGYTESIDHSLIVYTCKNSSRTWHSVLFCVPVD